MRYVVRHLRRNFVGWIALFFALTGTGIAASRYLITSKGQIKPSVVRELRSEVAKMAATPKGPKAIIDRIRLTSPTVTVTQPVEGPFEPPALPISGGGWTQLANQANALIGQVTVEPPPQDSCSGGFVDVSVWLDGQSIAYALVRDVTPYVPQATVQFDWSSAAEGQAAWLPDAPAVTSHGLQVRASDVCRDGSHYTIKAVDIDVLGFR